MTRSISQNLLSLQALTDRVYKLNPLLYSFKNILFGLVETGSLIKKERPLKRYFVNDE